MARLCERPDCSEPGAVAYGFDADRLLVWLASIQAGTDRHRAGVLCRRHADSLVVPIGWSLDDARDPIPRLFKASPPPGFDDVDAEPEVDEPRRTAAPRSARRRRKSGVADDQLSLREDHPGGDGPADGGQRDEGRTVAAVTGVASAAEDDPDATVAIPWMPDFDDELDDPEGVLDARSPLLARAFRGAARPR